MMRVRTDLHAGQAIVLDPGKLAQWAQACMQTPSNTTALVPAASQLAQKPLDAQALSAVLLSAAGSLHPQQFLSMVGSLQGYLGSTG